MEEIHLLSKSAKYKTRVYRSDFLTDLVDYTLLLSCTTSSLCVVWCDLGWVTQDVPLIGSCAYI